MASTIGRMDQTTEGSSFQGWGMGGESGRWSMEIPMRASTWMTRKMGRESTSGRTGQGMRETSRTTTGMGMGRWSGRTGGSTRASGSTGYKKIYLSLWRSLRPRTAWVPRGQATPDRLLELFSMTIKRGFLWISWNRCTTPHISDCWNLIDRLAYSRILFNKI